MSVTADDIISGISEDNLAFLKSEKISFQSLIKQQKKLLRAKKLITQKLKGKITKGEDDKLKLKKWKQSAESDEDTLVTTEVPDHKIRAGAIDLLLKMIGKYPSDKVEHTGKGGGPIEERMTVWPREPETDEEWEEWFEKYKNRNKAEVE